MDVVNHTETHHITAHGTTTLEVVYTNEEATVERILAMYEKWLEKEKNRCNGPGNTPIRLFVVFLLCIIMHHASYHTCIFSPNKIIL
jgi:CO dehydrogenase/acetyl-CoA synthase beta subunit